MTYSALRVVNCSARIVGDIELGETIRVEAVDRSSADLVSLAITFGEPPPHRRGPSEIHLLRADTSYQRDHQIGMQNRPKPPMKLREPPDYRVRPAQILEFR